MLAHDSAGLEAEQSIHRARARDSDTRQQLLARHRDRLCRMLAARLDRREAARLDPSDVVQDALPISWMPFLRPSTQMPW
ncbi:MAG TPA: hypothetical protein VFA18_20175 [Gemmataceae bacterium]|nr:hypothetical protein [Gemmataceae bacterium]